MLLAYSAKRQSPTFNEMAHLTAGVSHWEHGNFELYRVNPPLIRMVATIPVVLIGHEQDWSGYYDGAGARPVFGMGEDFVRANGRHSLWLLTISRWSCIPFSVLGAYICFTWSRSLFGTNAGLLAATFWCFSPMILGHASLIAPDAPSSAMGVWACFTFWRWLRTPTWTQAVVTGCILGLAELSKTTLIIFYPIWPIIWVIYRLAQTTKMCGKQWTREAGMLVTRMAIGLYVLNMGYLAEGSFTRLSEYEFISDLFGGINAEESGGGNRFQDILLGEVYVPFPRSYIVGIDIQQRDFEKFGRPSYLRGTFQATGWWYYYIYALLIKTPIGTLGLLVLSILNRHALWRPGINWNDGLVLLTPPVVIFLVISLKFGFSHHSRYTLPCYPFVFIWLGQFGRILEFQQKTTETGPDESEPDETADGHQKRISSRSGNRGTQYRVFIIMLVVWMIISSLETYPHSLAYFNEFVGGPVNGAEHLLNSNIDWGQDLLFLEDWVDRNAGDLKVRLLFYNWYNPFDLQLAGIEPWPFLAADGNASPYIEPGYYAISVNMLYESPWPARRLDGTTYAPDTRPFRYLKSVEPIGRAGYSIRIYSADQLRTAYKASKLATAAEIVADMQGGTILSADRP